MTRDEAIEVREKQLRGEPVRAVDLQDAIYILSKRRDRRLVLPKLAPEVKATLNACLCFNLGLACRRSA